MPEDVIKQLVGEVEEFDEMDVLCYSLGGCSKFEGKDIGINFEKGILQVYSGEGVLERTFAIKATLEEIPNLTT